MPSRGLSLLAAVSVVGQALGAGGLYLVMAAVVPAFRELPIPGWLELHRSLDRSIGRFMPWIAVVTLFAGVACQGFPQPPAERLLRGLAVACVVAAAVVTARVNIPINQIVSAQAGNRHGLADDELVRLRERWIAGHRARTLLAFSGLVLFVAAIA